MSSARSRRACAAAKAVDWRLVDEVVSHSKWDDAVTARAREIAARSDRPKAANGITLTPLSRKFETDRVSYSHVEVEIDRGVGSRPSPCAGRRRPRPLRSRPRMRWAPGSGRSPSRASWKTPFCICAPTRPAIGVVLFRTDGKAQAVLDARRFPQPRQWRLADARDPPLSQAGFEARRRHAPRASSP